MAVFIGAIPVRYGRRLGREFSLVGSLLDGR